MSRSYTSSPPSATMACSGTALLCVFFEVQTECLNIIKNSFGFRVAILSHDGVGPRCTMKDIDLSADNIFVALHYN
jgi:hypothetical protein